MDIAQIHWGSPIGVGVFFAGLGIYFWGFFNGLAAMAKAKAKAKHIADSEDSRRTA